MRRGNELVHIICCALLCACASVSPYPADHVAKFNKELGDVSATRTLESSAPQEAQTNYERILATVMAPNQAADAYLNRLENRMKEMTNANGVVLQEDDLLGFPEIYDRRLEVIAEARLGLARLAMSRSNWSEADYQARQALSLIQKKGNSPLFLAHESLLCYDLLRQAYAKQGKVGRERLVSLNQDLLREYSASKRGRQDFFAVKEEEELTEKQLAEADSYVRELNGQRREENARQWDQAMGATLGALQQVQSTVQQVQINQALAKSGGVVTPNIQRMQTAKMLTDFSHQFSAINPDIKKGMDAASSVLTPFTNVTLSQQLVNPDYGAGAPQAIKAFANEVATLSGDAKVKEMATMVNSSVDAVTAARGRDSDAMSAALGQFATSFSALQSQAEGIQTPAGKQ